MELRHLRYFVTVAGRLNFTKAAAKLRVAQPALSRQIHDLEDELGVALLERNSRFVRLTDAGRAFLTEAQAVLQCSEKAALTARAFATGERGEIHIGYAPSLSVELLPQALQVFEKQCPHVRVVLHDLSVSEMIQGLAEGRLDVALTARPLARQLRGLVFTRLRNYYVCIALNNHHPLARHKRVNLNQLKNERFIAYTRTEYPEYHEWVDTLFRQSQNTSPELFEEHDSGTSLITAVEAARGVAIVPSVFSCVVGQRLTLCELQPGPEPLSVGLAYRSRQLSPAARRFVKLTSALAA